jgi:hypothetical protein
MLSSAATYKSIIIEKEMKKNIEIYDGIGRGMVILRKRWVDTEERAREGNDGSRKHKWWTLPSNGRRHYPKAMLSVTDSRRRR